MRIETAAQYATRRTRGVRGGTRWTDRFTEFSAQAGLLIGHGSKPDHGARAVLIGSCFPPLGMAGGGRPYHPTESTYATPLDYDARIARYHQQNGVQRLTAAQRRRAAHKRRRAEG